MNIEMEALLGRFLQIWEAVLVLGIAPVPLSLAQSPAVRLLLCRLPPLPPDGVSVEFEPVAFR
ncbi:MAG: hypothetical protein N2652_10640 [Kiritimatiellae bacterium]|nr:hypothetical protein [Kiritimatiellia bacterium]